MEMASGAYMLEYSIDSVRSPLKTPHNNVVKKMRAYIPLS